MTDAGDDARIARALSHPLRVRVLHALNTHVATPTEIAEALDLPVVTVGYHVSMLLRFRMIEEVEPAHAHDDGEPRYRATNRVFAQLEDWRRMPQRARNGMAAEIGAAAFGDYRAALAVDALALRDDSVTAWTRVVLDDEGWRNVHRILTGAVEAVLDEHAASAGRMLQSGERGIRGAVSIFQHPVA